MHLTARLWHCSLMLWLAGCGGGAVATIRSQAAKDLSCHEAQVQVRHGSFHLGCEAAGLTVTALNADTFGVSGCGKKASYLVACHVDGCKAIQNTQSQ